MIDKIFVILDKTEGLSEKHKAPSKVVALALTALLKLA